jgi:hypothetical protein
VIDRWRSTSEFAYLMERGGFTEAEAALGLDRLQGNAMSAWTWLAQRRADAQYARDLIAAQQQSERAAREQRKKDEKAHEFLLMSGGDVLSSKLFERSELLKPGPPACCAALRQACRGAVGAETTACDFDVRGECLQLLRLEKKAIQWYGAVARHHMRRIGAELTRASETNVGPGPGTSGGTAVRPGTGAVAARPGQLAAGAPRAARASAARASASRVDVDLCSSDSDADDARVPGSAPCASLPLAAVRKARQELSNALFSLDAGAQGGAPASFLVGWRDRQAEEDGVVFVEQRGLESAGERGGERGRGAKGGAAEIVECF